MTVARLTVLVVGATGSIGPPRQRPARGGPSAVPTAETTMEPAGATLIQAGSQCNRAAEGPAPCSKNALASMPAIRQRAR